MRLWRTRIRPAAPPQMSRFSAAPPAP